LLGQSLPEEAPHSLICGHELIFKYATGTALARFNRYAIQESSTQGLIKVAYITVSMLLTPKDQEEDLCTFQPASSLLCP
jgi:hypothetical protein